MKSYFLSIFRWMQIRRIALKTVDGLSPLPMSSAWVRDGLFVIGMDRSNFSIKLTHLLDSDLRPESGWGNNHLLAKLSKLTKWQLFSPMIILKEHSCCILNLLSFDKRPHNSDYCLSLTQNSNLSQMSESLFNRNFGP